MIFFNMVQFDRRAYSTMQNVIFSTFYVYEMWNFSRFSYISHMINVVVWRLLEFNQ